MNATTQESKIGDEPTCCEAIHPDDEAVDRFAAALKENLAASRAKGRGGWENKSDVSVERLSEMLLCHVFKGDPRDVANFCMFLQQRGEAITLPEWAAAKGSAVIALQQVQDVIQRFLPPDGISKHDAMTEIISIVDKVPLLAADEVQG